MVRKYICGIWTWSWKWISKLNRWLDYFIGQITQYHYHIRRNILIKRSVWSLLLEMSLCNIFFKYYTWMTAKNDSNESTAPIHYRIFDIIIRLSSGIYFPDIIIKLRKTFDHKPMDHWNFSVKYKLKKLQYNCIKWISDVKHQRHLIITVLLTVLWVKLDYFHFTRHSMFILWICSRRTESTVIVFFEFPVLHLIFKLFLQCCVLY